MRDANKLYPYGICAVILFADREYSVHILHAACCTFADAALAVIYAADVLTGAAVISDSFSVCVMTVQKNGDLTKQNTVVDFLYGV